MKRFHQWRYRGLKQGVKPGANARPRSLGMAYTENPKPLKEPEGGKRCLDRWNQDKEWGKEKNIEKQRTTQDQEAYHIIYQTW